jgi:hypothetical protein
MRYQSCLKIKHQQHNFKSVPADSGGDYGLDGYNSIGDAYQCYCPEKEYTDKELYEHQRDKVTTDIQKLFDYQVKLTLLGREDITVQAGTYKDCLKFSRYFKLTTGGQVNQEITDTIYVKEDVGLIFRQNTGDTQELSSVSGL